MIAYYTKFIPNLASILSPLYSLLQKGSSWGWGYSQRGTFEKAKNALTSDAVLAHYDPEKQLILACDVSPYGIGAVLSQPSEEGKQLKPIAFASRTLAPAERNYSQLEREGLALVYGVKRYNQYLYGRRFTILSNHKPLEGIFHSSRQLSTMSTARIQRWVLTLGAYDYQVVYKPGSSIPHADCLSRLPLSDSPRVVPEARESILMMEVMEASMVTVQSIKQHTRRDPVLACVLDQVISGWKHSDDEALKPYLQRKEALSTMDGCVQWGARVIIPPTLRSKVLVLLHNGHLGMARMKSLARSYVWWPNLDADIEAMVRKCVHCQLHSKSPPSTASHPWEFPSQPWSRIHLDYAGPIQGQVFLVVVDSFSKWLEVAVVPSATSRNTIDKLREMCARHGIPEMVVTDNGTSFTSLEFQTFIVRNGIQHYRSAPYHPASNGLAERAVQTLKRGLQAVQGGDLNTRLSRFLLQYRVTPHSVTGIAPSELLMKRRLRTHLDLLKPDVSQKVTTKQFRALDSSQERRFVVGENVFVRNWGNGPKWLSGKVVGFRGHVNLEIQTSQGCVHRHVDQVKR